MKKEEKLLLKHILPLLLKHMRGLTPSQGIIPSDVECGKHSQILMQLHRGGSSHQVGSTCSQCVHHHSHAGQLNKLAQNNYSQIFPSQHSVPSEYVSD